MKIRLSVIVPLSGQEDDFDKGLVALMQQTIDKGVEWIFVASPEGEKSVEFVRRWIKSFPGREGQMRLIELAGGNYTLSGLLREGFLGSVGDYIAYADPNEGIPVELFEALLNRSDLGNADVVVHEGDATMAKSIVAGLDPQPLHGKIFSRDLYMLNGAGGECIDPEDRGYVISAQLMMTAKKIEVISKKILEVNPYTTVEGIEAVESYIRRHDLMRIYGKSLSQAKMRLKYRLLMEKDGSKLKQRIHLFKDVEPSVMEGTEMNFMARLALANARMGDTWLLRLLRLKKS